MATLTHIAHESLSLPHHEVDWEDISGSYQHLLMKIAARSDDTTGGTSYLSQFNLRFGNSSLDTGTNYSDTYMGAYSSNTALAGRSTGLNHIQRLWVPSSSVSGGTFGNMEIWIPNYTESNWKQIHVISAADTWSDSTYEWGYIHVAGVWRSTSAITHIQLEMYAGFDFVANSTFDLYGIAGAA